MEKAKINIAIDGPVASGKTTIGKKLAQKINYQFLDSGLLFRHFANFYLNFTKISLHDLEKQNYWEKYKEQIIETVLIWQKDLRSNQLQFCQELEKMRGVLSSPTISKVASQLSPILELRKVILFFQQALTKEKGWVVVGRDITSEVLPQAEIKIFLVADLKTRVARRYQEYKEKVDLITVEKELLTRDNQDQNRFISPLKRTEDSWEIDTTFLSPEEVIEKIIAVQEEKIRKILNANWESFKEKKLK